MLRVVLEEEWTKARQGTEEGCCWDAQDKLCLDSANVRLGIYFEFFPLIVVCSVWVISGTSGGKYHEGLKSCRF